MGKSKTRRQKYHASAVKLKQQASAGGQQPAAGDVEMTADSHGQSEPIILGADAGIFKNVNIDLSKATKELPDFDARSTITSKTLKELNLTKKEKRQMKHDMWMKRVDAIQAARKEAKEKKRRQATPIVGDMRPLEDTLPTLELLLRDTSSRKSPREEAKPKPIKKTKQRQKDMLKDIDVFQQVLQHPAFQQDPTATITEHLRNKLKQENSNT